MRYFLENEYIKAEFDSHGAELKSVLNKANYREYMWYGNSKYWGRTSPVLFPFVGSLKEKQFTWKGRKYPMGQHGFARDFEHDLIEQTDTKLTFSFCSNEETFQKFPFEFELRCIYELSGRELKVNWKVLNPSTKETLYFSIGAHPAFLCPVHGEEKKTGYRLYFEGADEIRHYGNRTDTGLAFPDESVLPLENHRAVITEDFFDTCTYFIADRQTGLVGIEDPEGHRIVDVSFDTPLFAIWSPEKKQAPFFCIEPWYGRCDAEDFKGELDERAYTNVLAPGGVFDGGYAMKFYTV